jgi:hypothetical protein
MIEALRQQAQAAGRASADTCDGSFNNLDPQLLRDLGFEELRLDAHMDYRFDVPAETLHASVGFELHDIESVQMSVELDGVVPEDVAQQRVGAPALARAEMSVDVSRNFGDRYMKLCAQRAGSSVEAFRSRLLERTNEELAASGVTLGAGLQQAMADLYRDWGELRLTVRPAEPLGPAHMFRLTPENLVEILGLNLRVNDRPVIDLSFDFDMQALMRQAQIQMEGGEASDQTRPELPPRVRITRHYQRVPLATLPQHVGNAVKIKPRGQPLRSGDLVSIDSREAQIRQRAHGGSFTSHVPLAEIESVEVLVVERELLKE